MQVDQLIELLTLGFCRRCQLVAYHFLKYLKVFKVLKELIGISFPIKCFFDSFA